MSDLHHPRPAIFFCLMGYRGAECVAEALLTRADVDLLTLEPTTKLLNDRGIPNETLHAYAPPDTVEKANDEALRRIEQVAGAMRNGPLKSRYPFTARATLDAAQDVLLNALRRDLISEMVLIDALHQAAEHRDLRLLVVSEDHSRDMRALVHYASQLGIPSLHVLHGVPVGPTVPMLPAAASHYAVYSEHLREKLAAHGLPADSISVTGNPGWDRFAGPAPSGATRLVYPETGLDPGRPVITYATSADRHWCHTEYPFPTHAEDNARAVLEAFTVLARRHPDWQFMLRPRASREDAAPYEAMAGQLPEDIRDHVRIDRLSPYHSIAVSDVLLCTQSNMGIEAILMGKPVINVDIEEYGAAMHHVGFGPAFDSDDAVLQAARADELAPMVERALLDPDTRATLRARRARSIERFNHPHDGRASSRVAELITRLMDTPEHQVAQHPAPWGKDRLAARKRALEVNREGEAWFAEGDCIKASACFLKAAQSDRACAVAFNNLAVTFLELRRPEDAWTYATEALHLDPYLAVARDNLRDVAAVLGRQHEAAELLDLFGGAALDR